MSCIALIYGFPIRLAHDRQVWDYSGVTSHCDCFRYYFLLLRFS